MDHDAVIIGGAFAGLAAATYLARAREQLAVYPGVTLVAGEAAEARVAGLQERWGKTVLHCPYCHGFEFSDRPLALVFR